MPGRSVCAWYPITPSTSLAEGFEKHAKRLRTNEDGTRNYAIVQAEDELSAIGIAIGGGWNGARSFTATSGPGVSLMSEFLGLAYFAEIPVVLYDVQRGGPSTGMPTRTQQSDIMSAAYASHGDTKHVLLLPANPTECFSMSREAFDLAERLQTPVMVLSDLDIGMNEWVTDPFTWDDTYVHDRGKVLDAKALDAAKDWGRYRDADGDAIPYRTLPGTHPTKGAFFTRGTSHDEYARYTEDGRIHARVIDRLSKKFRTAATLVPKPEIDIRDKSSRFGVIYFGATRPAVLEGLDLLAADGVRVNAMRLKAFPFPDEVKSVLRRARPRAGDRAEPRRADALAADDGGRHPRRQADRHAELRRLPADRRLGAQRRSGARRTEEGGGGVEDSPSSRPYGERVGVRGGSPLRRCACCRPSP